MSNAIDNFKIEMIPCYHKVWIWRVNSFSNWIVLTAGNSWQRHSESRNLVQYLDKLQCTAFADNVLLLTRSEDGDKNIFSYLEIEKERNINTIYRDKKWKEKISTYSRRKLWKQNVILRIPTVIFPAVIESYKLKVLYQQDANNRKSEEFCGNPW